MHIRHLAKRAYANAVEKGFYDEPPTIPERLCLVHSEISEALEAYRSRGTEAWQVESGEVSTMLKPEGLLIELADAVIRIADMTAGLGLDLEEAISEKMAYNELRPKMHGGKKL
jgi:NTP pyrophosphatase (non-canonical NTP hydrolase)